MFGGFQKSSLIEYPEKISAVVFTIGCNFRCPFCQNYRLVLPGMYSQNKYNEDEVLKYLKAKRNLLDAVSITGGEPTLHGIKLIEFIRKVKELGLLVQLETNGSNPSFVKKVIAEHLVDYIAMDIKGPLRKYPLLTGIENFNSEPIIESIKLITKSAPDYEFRTTYVPLLEIDDFHEIGSLIKGARHYIIQKFEAHGVLNPEAFKNKQAPTEKAALRAAEIARKYVEKVTIRGFNNL